MTDLRSWLATIGLEKYLDSFAANRIDADVLADLTEGDLEKLSIPLGDRKRLLKAIALLREQEAARKPAPVSKREHDESAAPSSDHRVERRQLTLMFVDLVGSTALSERLDLEEYRAVIKAHHERCTALLRTHNGFIAQFQGDGVLAYFGYPRAGEDDAERAVVSALEIVRAVGGMEAEPGVSLQARVGIASGLVAIGDLLGEGFAEKWTATGETPNLAARLQSLAAPGEVVVCDVTRQLLGNQFVCEDLGPRSLKGFSSPVQAWRVTDVRAAISRFESRQRGDPTLFVDREEEIELLQRRWRGAKADRGHTVLISGEPGIGKSRLAEVFCDQVRSEPHRRLRYQCLPNRTGSPFHPIISQLELAIGLAASDNSAAKLDKLERWVQRELPGAPEAVKVFAKLLSVPTDQRLGPLEMAPKEFKDTVFRLLSDLLAGLLDEAPVVLVFEDLQWIDPTSQELLDALIERIPGRRLFMICTCRTDYEPQWIGDAGVTYLNMRRLDGRQSAAVIDNISGGFELPPELEAEILSKTDGVPLFLEELTKAVLESGSLRRVGRAYRLDPHSDVLTVLPTSLLGSLLARLDRLPGAQNVAPFGAAIGRTFGYELLRKVVDLDEKELQSVLTRLLDAQLLSQRGHPPEAVYSFKHALVQDAAYETLPKGRRREVHRRIAATLVDSFPEVSATKPEIIANHFARSDAPAEALDYWRRAAILARQSSANVEAIALIKNALAANEHLTNAEDRVSNEIELREMLEVSLEVTNFGSMEIADNFLKLRKLREARGDKEELLSVLHGICGDHILGGRVTDARRLARKMLKVAKEKGDQVAAILGNRCLGLCDFLAGDFPGAISHFEKTISLCSQIERDEIKIYYYYADSVLISRALISWSLMLSGQKAAAKKTIHEVIRLTEDEPDVHSKTYALCILASIYESARDPRASLRFASRALELSREHRSHYWEAWAQIMKGWALAIRGRHNQGIGELKEGIAKYKRTGARQMLPYALALLADAFCSAGHVVEGLDIVQKLEKARDPREIRYIDVLVARVRERLTAAAEASRS